MSIGKQAFAPIFGAAVTVEPRVIHSSQGRLRVHLPLWSGKGEKHIEGQFSRMHGVRSVHANAVTGNILFVYDPATTSESDLVAQMRGHPVETVSAQPHSARSVVTEGTGNERRVRIAMNGLDRNANLGQRAVQLLRRRGVRAWSKPVTGHILVEYDQYEHVLKELIALVAQVELPAKPGEDRPSHPLDPMPLWQSVTRAVGSLVGMGIITYRRLSAPPGTVTGEHGAAATAAGVFNLLHGIPFIRNRLNEWMGTQAADLFLDSMGIVTLTLADTPLGLILAGLDALTVVGEVTARRSAWRRYENNLDSAASADPGAVVRLEAGATLPRAANIIEGTGTATSASGLPISLAPGCTAPAGAVLSGGPFVLELQASEEFEIAPRPMPKPTTLYDDYHRIGGWLSLAYVGFSALRTRSLVRTFEALLLLNPRTSVIGLASANIGAAARALRSGLTVVGTRRGRDIQLPQVLVLDGTRLLTDGLEIAQVCPSTPAVLESEVLAVAAIVSAAAGAPWGAVFPKAGHAVVSCAEFNGLWATAVVDGDRYTLGAPEDIDRIPEEFLLEHLGGYVLELRNDEENTSFGLIALRPRLHREVQHLVSQCQKLGVQVELLSHGAAMTAKSVARRAGLTISAAGNAVDAIRRWQQQGALVAFVSDHAEAAPAFAACDLAVGIASPRTGEFPARADILAPDLHGVADLLETGSRRDKAVRHGVHLSIAANVIGAILGLGANPLGPERANLTVYLAALAAMGASAFRLRGGQRNESSLAHLSDPRPERWARRSLEDVVRALNTTEAGLGTIEAASRRQMRGGLSNSDQLLASIRNQLKSPITAVLAGGACVTLVLGQPLNTALIGFTTSLNVIAGVWQEREIGKAAEAIKRLSAGIARVLRDHQTIAIPNSDVVPGDVLILGPGDRVSADARMLSASGLEVNEAALTGESLPVPKGPEEFTDIGRIVLEGSDVVVGHGRAVVVAVGRHTRLGATAAALNVDRSAHSPMAQRLGRILQIALPLSFGGGALAGIAGMFYGGAAAAQLAVGVTTALSAIPEGLPLLAGVGQAGVASRLASKNALVRRIAAVEALGRVDVACTDKTGTMTEGRLALRLIADMDIETLVPGPLPAGLRPLLLTAALASPHPEARDTLLHPTDLAVVRGAMDAGLADDVKAPRLAEIAFDSARAFHASLVTGRLCVKGAPEKLVPRCAYLRFQGKDLLLDETRRAALLACVVGFAERGLRVLLIAEGPPDASPNNPHGLTALGFVAISDPLRVSVPEAVKRCQEAGIRVIMLTGDHPATAQAIAREAGLLIPGNNKVLRAADLAELSASELDQSLEGVAVIARAAPLDKLRIIESLRRRGHIVAMTGDGVNDAPSLRLADVGVAMGRSGTEVARQAADVVLTDDDFATLVEALVEGRGFWRNMRTALGLLLGGNAGELGVIVGASVLGFGSPLSTVQILLVNLITDALPALAVVLQRPQKRDLAGLAREGLSALDSGLRRDVLRRGLATAIPTLGAYLYMQSVSNPVQASSVAFASVVATQLAQTLDAGRVQGSFSGSVMKAVGASAVILGSCVTVPPVRDFLGLTTPSLMGCGVIGVSSVASVLMSRAISELAADPTLRVFRPEEARSFLLSLKQLLRLPDDTDARLGPAMS